MNESSQFQLLGTKRLGPLFVTQFFGAFNDNLYKAALASLFVYGGIVAEERVDLFNNVAGVLLVIPFLLFSAIAGTLADSIEKSRLVRKIKLAEIAVAAAIVLAVYLQNLAVLLFVLFLLGTQSAFFGPVKFSLLPQHLKESELIGGNAVIETGTFVAILGGIVIGTLIGAMEGVMFWLGTGVIAVAVIGYIASYWIPESPSYGSVAKNWNAYTATCELISIATERKDVFLSILGISWFWLFGGVYVTQIPNFTRTHLGGNADVVALIVALITISIAIGSLLCERLSRRRIEIGLVPVGAGGISIFGIAAYFAIEGASSSSELSLLEFLAGDGVIPLLVHFALMSFFAGIYVVPLQAVVQYRTAPEKRARIIAANNILNSLFTVFGMLFAILWLTVFDFSIPALFLVLALVNIGVAAFIFNQIPEFTMRFIVWLIGHSMYRVQHEGLEHVPDREGAVIVCNHVSYVDALLLAGAVRRPIRFIMFKPIYDTPVLNFVFRTGHAIPINQKDADPKAYDDAFEQIREGLESNDLLCIFPEGRLTPDGEMCEFRPGIEKIVQTTPVPVIPMALRGLWGSFFSLYGGGVFKKPNRFWSRVVVVAGPAILPDKATIPNLYQRVKELRGTDGE